METLWSTYKERAYIRIFLPSFYAPRGQNPVHENINSQEKHVEVSESNRPQEGGENASKTKYVHRITHPERSIMIAWLTGRITTQTLVTSLQAVIQANDALFTTAASASTDPACSASAR